MLKNSSDYLAAVQFPAVSAGIIPLFMYAFADLAIIAAKRKFHAVCPAAHTIDGRRCDLRRIVHYAPLLGCFFSQIIVIGDGGYTGVAAFAVQSAAGNQLFHLLVILGSKYRESCLSCQGFSLFAHVHGDFRSAFRDIGTGKNSFAPLLQGSEKCRTLVHRPKL